MIGLALATTAVGVFAAPAGYEEAIKEAQKSDEAKDYVAAHKSLDSAFAVVQTPQEKARVMIALGRLYNDEGKPSKAREAWQQVVDLQEASNEQKWVALAAIAGALLSEKNYSGARGVLSKIVSDPLIPASLSEAMRLQFAQSYASEGNVDVAQTEFAKIAGDTQVTAPIRFFAYSTKGRLNFEASKWEQARADYIKALGIPGIGVINVAQVRYGMEQTYWKENNKKEALNLNITFKRGLNQQASTFMSEGKYQQARDYYQAILIASGEHENPVAIAVFRTQLAQAYTGEANYEQARKELQGAFDYLAQLKGRDDELGAKVVSGLQAAEQSARLEVAETYFKEGNKAMAAQEYQKVLDLPNLAPQFRTYAQEQLAKSKA